MLDVLRGIGKKLYDEFGRGDFGRVALDRGASGDRTYEVDRRAEEIVFAGLEASGVPLTVVSEETGIFNMGGGGERYALVDPIDGSKNSVTGVPYYCTSIAVARNGRIGGVELAYIVNLVNGEEYWAERGEGAFRNGGRVRAQQDDYFRCCLFEAQAPGRDIGRILPLLAEFRRVRALGAVALDLALLSQGAASVFVSPSPSRSFDFAAGWLLVGEAGGVFTDLEGNDIGETEAGLGHVTPLLASANASLHERALRLLAGGQER